MLALTPCSCTNAEPHLHRQSASLQLAGLCVSTVNTSPQADSSSHADTCLPCRSFIPVICCLLAIGIENKIPTGKEIGSLVILSLGVMIAVWEGSVNGSPHGIMLCIVGTVCNAAMMSTSGRILSEKLDVLRLAFYTAPVSCIALFPFCYFREVS